jgi:branched-chain amino acid transport system ATP-binding protein
MAAILEVEDLHVSYGETRVLHGIGFAVEARGITTILGANGAGKTTTLRAVSGIVPPRGRIALDGRRIDGKACEDIARLGIAHVPEGRGTFVGFTVEENLRLGATSGATGRRSAGHGARLRLLPVLGQRREQPSREASSRCSRSPVP